MELHPCRYCGNIAVYLKFHKDENQHLDYWAVACDWCGAEGPQTQEKTLAVHFYNSGIATNPEHTINYRAKKKK